jgi:manganese-dependent inorganic pyrophosphatase
LFRATVRVGGTFGGDGSATTRLPEHPDGPALFLVPAGGAPAPESLARPGDVVVLCGAQAEESAEHATNLPDVEIIPSAADLVQSAVSVVLARTLEAFTVSPEPVFSPTDRVLDVQKEIAQYNQGGFIVAEEDGSIAGVITRISFLAETRFNVTLVDHNELSQSIEGIEHADVVEIIDHHRIGTRSTDSPITFINRVVGCTCTIIAEMYRSRGEAPDATTALLMLAAILSDTVILRSPTTTDADRGAAEWLAGIAGVNPESFGKAMFEAGSVIATKPADELVSQDRKSYTEGAYNFSVSQIETVGFEAFHARSAELQQALDAVVQEGGYDFGCLMVTDITEECTLLLFCGPERIREAIDYPEVERGVYELSGVLSRKKQLLPYFVDMLRRLEG